MIQTFVDGDPDRAPMTLGVVLMMCSGIAVVGIGLLMYPVLRDVSPRLAGWYPGLRITECLVSATCGIYLLAQSHVVPNHLLWVYVPTGLGGIVLTYLLLVGRLVPRAIAMLGLVGYISLTIGVPLDLLGVLDMSAGTGTPPGPRRAVRVRVPAGLADRQGIPYDARLRVAQLPGRLSSPSPRTDVRRRRRT